METITLKINSLFTKSEIAVKTKEGVLQFGPALVINAMLLAAGAILVVYYIVGANAIASDSYKAKLLNDRLMQLNEEQSTLLSQKASIDESSIAREFALSHNMVEAKNFSYIFETRNVAQR